jgi:hypothetical protein
MNSSENATSRSHTPLRQRMRPTFDRPAGAGTGIASLMALCDHPYFLARRFASFNSAHPRGIADWRSDSARPKRCPPARVPALMRARIREPSRLG